MPSRRSLRPLRRPSPRRKRAMLSPRNRRKSLAEEFKRICTDAATMDGHFDLAAATVELAAYIEQHPDPIDAQTLAQQVAQTVDHNQRPPVPSAQLSMWQSDAWIPT